MKVNLGELALKAGGIALNAFLPGVGTAAVSLVNSFLPDDKKLPEDATGDQVKDAIKSLPPEKQAEVMSKELDVEIEKVRSHTEVVKTLAEVDKAGASTRPQITKAMAQILAFQLVVCTVAWAVAVLWNKTDMVTRLANSWELILALMAYPMWVIKAYYGARQNDKQMRASVAMGKAPDVGGSLLDLFRKKG